MMNNRPVAAMLGKVLATTHALGIKTRNYHWNVEGPHFAALHALFDDQYNELTAAIEAVAERMRAVGAYAPGGLDAFARLSSIKDAPESPPSALTMVADLAAGHRAAAEDARQALEASQEAGDEVTLELMVQRVDAHDKAAWMLDAHLSK